MTEKQRKSNKTLSIKTKLLLNKEKIKWVEVNLEKPG